MEENQNVVRNAYPEGSFARLFWVEQLKAAKVADARQRHWHPLMIKWCINFKLMSTATYHILPSSGFLHLPSERTLCDFTNYVRSRTGFQTEINEQLQKEISIESFPPSKCYVALLIDEMNVKEDLVYEKHTGQVVGFVSVGDDLSNMELKCTGNSPHPQCLLISWS